jgi:hypothetical protein
MQHTILSSRLQLPAGDCDGTLVEVAGEQPMNGEIDHLGATVARRCKLGKQLGRGDLTERHRLRTFSPLAHDDTERPLGALPPRSVHLHPQPYELARGHHRLPVDVDDGRDRAVRDPPIDARLGEGEKARRTSTGDGAAGG